MASRLLIAGFFVCTAVCVVFAFCAVTMARASPLTTADELELLRSDTGLMMLWWSATTALAFTMIAVVRYKRRVMSNSELGLLKSAGHWWLGGVALFGLSVAVLMVVRSAPSSALNGHARIYASLIGIGAATFLLLMAAWNEAATKSVSSGVAKESYPCAHCESRLEGIVTHRCLDCGLLKSEEVEAGGPSRHTKRMPERTRIEPVLRPARTKSTAMNS